MIHIKENPKDVIVIIPKDALFNAQYESDSFVTDDWNQANQKPTDDSSQQERTTNFKRFFDPAHNPIMAAMNTTAGTGMPGVITQLGLDWKLGEYAWELDPGNRRPMGCEITVSFSPIHEITPGLDSQGANRAPVFQARPTTKIGLDE